MPLSSLNQASTTRKPRYFYGWNIVAASFLAGLSYAEHFSSILGLFFKPIQSEFGWSRSAIAGVQTTGRVIEALIAPIIGPIIDRYGPRVLMPIGAIIVGLAMLGVTQINTIWHFLILRGVLVAIGDMVANSFLPHQVRNTVGSLIKVGQGKMTVDEFYGMVEAKRPGLAGPTAPAGGLCLMRVNYPSPFGGDAQ